MLLMVPSSRNRYLLVDHPTSLDRGRATILDSEVPGPDMMRRIRHLLLYWLFVVMLAFAHDAP
jgi:hypothetical protein